MTQTPPPPAPPPAPATSPTRPLPTTQTPQIDCKWLTVDTTAKTATFQLVAGLTGPNGALHFNGFKDGGKTLTMKLKWKFMIAFRKIDEMLPHTFNVIASA